MIAGAWSQAPFSLPERAHKRNTGLKKTLLRERTKPPGNGWAKCGAVIGKQLPGYRGRAASLIFCYTEGTPPACLFALEDGMKIERYNQYVPSTTGQFGPVQLPRSCGFQPGPEAQE